MAVACRLGRKDSLRWPVVRWKAAWVTVLEKPDERTKGVNPHSAFFQARQAHLQFRHHVVLRWWMAGTVCCVCVCVCVRVCCLCVFVCGEAGVMKNCIDSKERKRLVNLRVHPSACVALRCAALRCAALRCAALLCAAGLGWAGPGWVGLCVLC